ncbi:outer-membrane lipoprotein carrier protein LolA [Mergibacter septicus]|uniref:outer membrane lipoprotein chaperone LolA n=1 Tax=Mergibacter septicus TaxID=221402 RepID=UPI001C77964C|nr:outer membrane lipoprotein chaperone LolA [Mergibacter septicus]QDJ12954.1 outer-membrane lipoprotein carrier protein LolA [Mergibacter septicus]
MKKIGHILGGFLCLLLSLPLGFAAPTAQQVLQQRLGLLNSFSATFQQTVKDPSGKVITQGSGLLQLKRPNLFRLDNQSPQESLIVSDGKTLWFYDPFVEQVTANWLSEVISNTPFILISSNDQNIWQQYQVSQKGDTFTFTPKLKQNRLRQFNLEITAKGELKGFNAVEQDGQINLYQLKNISTKVLADSLFQFKLPQGVELDDQRK